MCQCVFVIQGECVRVCVREREYVCVFTRNCVNEIIKMRKREKKTEIESKKRERKREKQGMMN